ncbi:MAG: efflux RND transporter periplasmic adaptor subunit [Terriglobia bacterium]
MTKTTYRWVGTLLGLGVLLGAGGCKLSGSSPIAGEVSAAQAKNPLEISASKMLMERLRIGEPSWAEVSSTLRVPARVEVDRRRAVRVGAPVDGRVTELYVHEGDMVQLNQPLASIYSTQLSETQAAFLKAYTRQQLAQKAVDRAQQLLKADVIGVAELQRREAELAEAAAEVNAGRDQLAVLGMSKESIGRIEQTRIMNSVTRLVASASGTILERNVTVGQVVQTSDTAFVIADLANVWLVADVPEQSAGEIHLGYDVEAEIPALPGRELEGRISFVSPIVNPETRTVLIHMDLPNPRGFYKPAMLANMTLRDQASREWVIPMTAVVRENDREYVFVRMNENTFVLREVELGGQYQGRRVLLNGLKSGEQIVLDGAFHLNNERRRQAVRSEEG